MSPMPISSRRPRRPTRRWLPFVAVGAETLRRRIVLSGIATTSSSQQVRKFSGYLSRNEQVVVPHIVSIVVLLQSESLNVNYDASQVRRIENAAKAIPLVSRSS